MPEAHPSWLVLSGDLEPGWERGGSSGWGRLTLSSRINSRSPPPAVTALLFKMEEANLASRAKAQELIQATNQVGFLGRSPRCPLSCPLLRVRRGLQLPAGAASDAERCGDESPAAGRSLPAARSGIRSGKRHWTVNARPADLKIEGLSQSRAWAAAQLHVPESPALGFSFRLPSPDFLAARGYPDRHRNSEATLHLSEILRPVSAHARSMSAAPTRR